MKISHNYSNLYRVLALAVATSLWATPLLPAQTAAPANGTDTTPASQSANTQQANTQNLPDTPAPQDPRLGNTESAMPDPSRGPQRPARQTNKVAPATTSKNGSNASTPVSNGNASQPAQQQGDNSSNYQEPSGAAVAQRGATNGGAASRPAGAAIAPAKQHRVRSLVIKIGAVAAGAAAVGTIYALSRGTPSTPPGARTTAATHP